jgi:hypothetical protein
MKMKICLLLAIVIVLGSCSKGFLDTKPNSNITQPTTLGELEKMLESDGIIFTPALPVLSADEYYYFLNFQNVSATEQNTYTWSKDVFGGERIRQDWKSPYSGIFYANNVLETLETIDSAGTNEGKKIKGWALFVRAYNYYNLVKNFARLYDATNSKTDPGVPLKLTAPIETLPRASVQAVYDQILLDLVQARKLLPAELPINRNRPCLMAVDALLARVGVTMQNYTLAEKYADSCLFHYKTLINYNTILPLTTARPFRMNNEEVLFASTAVQSYPASRVGGNSFISIDTILLKLYNINDTRATVYYGKLGTGQTILKFGYFGFTSSFPFSGLATDEVYLIKAECAARRNALDTCLYYLNTLLVNRYKTGSFTDLTATTWKEALDLVLIERRKELVWRGLRWDDLARFNKEGANITLKRLLNNQTYLLEPGSARYVFNIPIDEIEQSNIIQNER